MWPNPQEIANLVTFTKEILNGILQFLCSPNSDKWNPTDSYQEKMLGIVWEEFND